MHLYTKLTLSAIVSAALGYAMHLVFEEEQMRAALAKMRVVQPRELCMRGVLYYKHHREPMVLAVDADGKPLRCES